MSLDALLGSSTLIQLLACTALLVVGGFACRRRLRMRGGSPILRTIRLGPGHRLDLVEMEGQHFLVGCGPGAAPSLLHTWLSTPSRDPMPALPMEPGARSEGAISTPMRPVGAQRAKVGELHRLEPRPLVGPVVAGDPKRHERGPWCA